MSDFNLEYALQQAATYIEKRQYAKARSFLSHIRSRVAEFTWSKYLHVVGAYTEGYDPRLIAVYYSPMLAEEHAKLAQQWADAYQAAHPHVAVILGQRRDTLAKVKCPFDGAVCLEPGKRTHYVVTPVKTFNAFPRSFAKAAYGKAVSATPVKTPKNAGKVKFAKLQPLALPPTPPKPRVEEDDPDA